MRVKVCGITNLEDALAALRAGAHALGFIFYPKSPRYITPEKARELITSLPPYVERVGVFVEETPDTIDQICKRCCLSLAQIHWGMEQTDFESIEHAKIRVVRVKQESDLHKYSNQFRLVDAWVEGYGGEGTRIALEWFRHTDNQNIILAGGLTSQNLDELQSFGFYGVDVCSGVEQEPGIKNQDKLNAFVTKALTLS